jgi:hypothetical protein
MDIKKILHAHKDYLKTDGKEGAKADLQFADLQFANLRGAKLEGAHLKGANLRGANLQFADLQDADLRYADLRDANLQDADLRYADLRYAYLQGANLQFADLQDANLRGANLLSANLQGANLNGVKGFLLLPVQDLRGYSFTHALQTNEGWRIRAGCRDFSIEEAKAHWGEGYDDREIGDMYLYAVEWLEKKVMDLGLEHQQTELIIEDAESEAISLIKYIATDYVELSHDKVQWQRNDYIKLCRKFLDGYRKVNDEK